MVANGVEELLAPSALQDRRAGTPGKKEPNNDDSPDCDGRARNNARRQEGRYWRFIKCGPGKITRKLGVQALTVHDEVGQGEVSLRQERLAARVGAGCCGAVAFQACILQAHAAR